MVMWPFILHPMIRTMEPSQVVYYGIDFGGLNQSERDVALAGAAIAFASWEKNNPGLVFQEGRGGMTITFADWWPTYGIAMCPPWENSETNCHILLSPNTVRASSDTGYNERRTAEVLAHEIGHVFGFMHTGADGHLMKSADGWVFDRIYEREHEFVIPDPLSLYD